MKKKLFVVIVAICLFAMIPIVALADTGAMPIGDYVGYLVPTYDPASNTSSALAVSVETANGTGTAVPNIYVVDTNIYNNWNSANLGSADAGER